MYNVCTHFALRSANQFLVKIVNPSWFKKDPLPSAIVASIIIVTTAMTKPQKQLSLDRVTTYIHNFQEH